MQQKLDATKSWLKIEQIGLIIVRLVGNGFALTTWANPLSDFI